MRNDYRKRLGGLIWYILLALLVIFGAHYLDDLDLVPAGDTNRNHDVQWFAHLHWSYQRVFDRFNILRWTLNSLIVSTGATLLVLILDSLAGYALARMEFVGRGVIFAVILSMLFVPMQITVVPLFLLFAEVNLTDTYLALILPVGANVTGVFLMRQFFLSIPTEDAARVDSANTLRIWWSVVLPLARPALTAVAIVTFLKLERLLLAAHRHQD